MSRKHIRNRMRFFKKTLYSLKRSYGVKGDIYHITLITQDATTGRKILNREKYPIKRLILLPVTLSRELKFSGQWTNTTQGFPPGGFDVSERIMIIDNDDLPNEFEFGLNDYIIIEHQRYDIKSTNITEDGISTIIKTIQVKGGQVNEIHDLSFKQKLTFNQSVENE